MGLPGFYNDNRARAYPLVPFSSVPEAPPDRPARTRLLEPPAASPAGRWTLEGGGRSGGHLRSEGGSPTGVATWRFPVVPGRDYRVSATWPGYLGEAADVRHTADDVAAGIETRVYDERLDQTLAPAGRTGYDDTWLDLGTFTAAGTELVVRVHDDATGATLADAIWVEDVTVDPPPVVVEIRPPLDTLVDFGCMVGPGSGYDDARHSVFLHEIRRAGDDFAFEFRSDAPGLRAHALVFSRTLADPEYATDHAAATFLGAAEPGSCPGEDPFWEGFLVTGPLASLAARLPADGALTATTGAAVEPALVQNLSRGSVRSINLANQARTLATPPADCPAPSPTPDRPPTVVHARCLTGELWFKEGYNFTLRQSSRDNSLTFGARVGAGAGEPCAEVPLVPDEAPPEGSTLLGGGPACSETITALNGLSGRVLRLAADRGVRIVPAQDDPHTLVVDFDMHDLTACGAVEEVFEELPDV